MHFRTFTLSAAILAAAASAHAEDSDWFFKPYLGADYQYSHYRNETIGAGVASDDLIDTGLHGGNIHAGVRLHKYLGVELGHARTEEGDTDASNVLVAGVPLGQTKTRVNTTSLDILGYYPVAPKTELIGTVGVAYSKAKISESTGVLTSDESEWKPRIGAGVQYWLTDNLNTRGLVRYQGADFDSSVDNAVIATLGVNWQF